MIRKAVLIHDRRMDRIPMSISHVSIAVLMCSMVTRDKSSYTKPQVQQLYVVYKVQMHAQQLHILRASLLIKINVKNRGLYTS